MTSSFFCSHRNAIKDDEGYVICEDCGSSFYDGPLRERDLMDAFDAVWRQGYEHQPGLPPSFRMRLEEDEK